MAGVGGGAWEPATCRWLVTRHVANGESEMFRLLSWLPANVFYTFMVHFSNGGVCRDMANSLPGTRCEKDGEYRHFERSENAISPSTHILVPIKLLAMSRQTLPFKKWT